MAAGAEQGDRLLRILHRPEWGGLKAVGPPGGGHQQVSPIIGITGCHERQLVNESVTGPACAADRKEYPQDLALFYIGDPRIRFGIRLHECMDQAIRVLRTVEQEKGM